MKQMSSSNMLCNYVGCKRVAKYGWRVRCLEHRGGMSLVERCNVDLLVCECVGACVCIVRGVRISLVESNRRRGVVRKCITLKTLSMGEIYELSCY